MLRRNFSWLMDGRKIHNIFHEIVIVMIKIEKINYSAQKKIVEDEETYPRFADRIVGKSVRT
jgi:hypothetical protein